MKKILYILLLFPAFVKGQIEDRNKIFNASKGLNLRSQAKSAVPSGDRRYIFWDPDSNRVVVKTGDSTYRGLLFNGEGGGGGSGVIDGDKGDITVSASGATWTVDNTAITFAKLQNIATARILGRTTASSGSVEELTVGSGLSLSGGVLNTSGTPFLVGGNTYGGTVVFGGLDNNHLDIKANNVIVGRINAAGEFIWSGSATQTDNGAYPLQFEARTWFSRTSGNSINANTDGVNDDVATYHWSINSNSQPNTVWTTPSSALTWLVRDYASTTNLFTLGADNNVALTHLLTDAATTGKKYSYGAINTFNPTSGSASRDAFIDSTTVNQTGGANGRYGSFHSILTKTACADCHGVWIENSDSWFGSTSGSVAVGIARTTAPTARLHLGAGTATASTAPLKFTSGTNLGTAEAGAMEYNGTSLFFSPSTTRLRAVLTDNSIPSNGQIPIGNGTNYTNANITSTGSTITVTNGAGTINIDIPSTVLASGTYTPTLTGVANVESASFNQAFYSRNGNIVTVMMYITIDPTATGATTVGITLPVASNFASGNDLLGTGTCTQVPAQTVTIAADTGNDRANLVFVATDATAQAFYFTFTYQIL